MAMTQRAITLNIQPITAPCLRHSATGQPVTIFASRLNVILRRVAYHWDGNFPGESGEFRGLRNHSGLSELCRRNDVPDPDVVDEAILSNAADHLDAVFRAPGHPANTTPAATLSNADPAGDLSGDGGTSGALLHGDCLDVMARLPNSCFRAVVTSPPYNLCNSSGNGMRDGRGAKWEQAALLQAYAAHTDAMPHSAYVG